MKRSSLRRTATGLVRRTRIAPFSSKRAKENALRRAVLHAKFGDRPWRCVFWDYFERPVGVPRPPRLWWAPRLSYAYPPDCFGKVDGHEIKSRAQGGSITDPDNIVPLCAVHNEFVATHRALGEAIGLRR